MALKKELVETKEVFVYNWPKGAEEFKPAHRYRVRLAKKDVYVTVGYTYRHAFGQDRRRIIVFISTSVGLWPAIEFVGADDYEKTQELLCTLKKPSSNKHYRVTENPHQDYQEFKLIPFKSRILAPRSFNSWAAIVKEEDIDSIISLSMIRAGHRGRFLPTEFPPKNVSDYNRRAIKKTIPTASGKISEDSKQVAEALLKYGKKLKESHNTKDVEFTPDKEANDFILQNPLAFLVAVLCDQGIPAERAWALPYQLKQRLGHFEPLKISQMQTEELIKVMKSHPALHRFNRKMAKSIILACRKVVKSYDGDASKIWSDMPKSRDLENRFREFHGIGQKKASMAVNILARDFGVPVRDYENIDVSYDIHVRRVFLRSGIVNDDSEKTIISAGRELNPSYPGALDLPAWNIGRNWCHPSAPVCEDCPINGVCGKRTNLDVVSY
jgi:uncharacterized HhH-GPD family protein